MNGQFCNCFSFRTKIYFFDSMPTNYKHLLFVDGFNELKLIEKKQKQKKHIDVSVKNIINEYNVFIINL